jgi:hypothetical protein
MNDQKKPTGEHFRLHRHVELLMANMVILGRVIPAGVTAAFLAEALVVFFPSFDLLATSAAASLP